VQQGRQPVAHRGFDHRIRRRLRPQQRPVAIAPGRHQSDLAERLRLLRDLRLALAEQRRELADGQFILGTQREQTQPVFVSEEAEEVGAWSELHEELFILECA
jgi:hypothetical protein